MNDDAQVGKHPAEIVVLKPEEFSQIPEINRVSVARGCIRRAAWRNRDFKDFNALATQFDDCDFRYSKFERAYFRDAKFTNCRFDGAQFFDCNFKGGKFLQV